MLTTLIFIAALCSANASDTLKSEVYSTGSHGVDPSREDCRFSDPSRDRPKSEWQADPSRSNPPVPQYLERSNEQGQRLDGGEKKK